MTNKDNLQKEIQEKVKPGIKPSDLKKERQKEVKKPISPSPISINEEDEGYISEEEKKIIPTPPPLPNSKIKNLQTQIKALERQLQTYKDFKEADLKIKERYKEEIKELERIIKGIYPTYPIIMEEEKPHNVKKYIGELEAKIQECYKTIEELKKQDKNPIKDKGEVKELFNCYYCKKSLDLSLLVLELPERKLCQPCWAIYRKKAKEKAKEPPKENKSFTCYNCQETKTEKPFKVKLDATLIEYFICSLCLPLIKEYNEKELDSERELEEWE